MLKMATLFLCLKDLLVVEVTEISIITIHIRVSLVKKISLKNDIMQFSYIDTNVTIFFTFNFL